MSDTLEELKSKAKKLIASSWALTDGDLTDEFSRTSTLNMLNAMDKDQTLKLIQIFETEKRKLEELEKKNNPIWVKSVRKNKFPK